MSTQKSKTKKPSAAADKTAQLESEILRQWNLAETARRERDDARRALKSLVVDVEAMQDATGEAPNTFGPFQGWDIGNETYIQWVNLAHHLDKAKAILGHAKEAR